MLRCVIAAVCGLIAGSVANMSVILLSWAIYPPPEGANLSDPETMNAYVQTLPLPALLIVLVAHAGGALVGGFVAALIARRSRLWLGAIVGGFFLIGGIMNVLSIPCPLWFAIIDLASYVPCGILGARLAAGRTDPTSTAPPAT